MMKAFRSISRIFWTVAYLCACSVAWSANVTNVRALQWVSTSEVSIRYDLEGLAGETATIIVSYSTNDGETWSSGALSLSGDAGAGVPVGLDKEILWTAAADLLPNYYSDVRVRVEIDGNENPAPAGMVLVEGGTLAMSMGTVSVDTFHIGKYEVTWGEWQTVRVWAASNGYDIGSVGAGCAADHPVHTVAWFDVVKWCNAKSEMEGLTPVYGYNSVTYRSGEPNHTSISQNLSASGYRLPQEAEWEFAARGGNQTHGYTYSGSNTVGEVAWYWDNSSGAACNLSGGRGTRPVGEKAANELGLHDMSGNVWEWCWDAYSSSYRRIRGGSWDYDASYCSVSYRAYYSPGYRFNYLGFRLARSSGQ